ncbi:MAG TPA: germination protein YpeB [Clostridia bacterium]|nr:germination protein YpeB [Clostridia bacterium]
MFGIKRRRTLIRVLSYTISAFALSIIIAVSGFVMAYKFRMTIEYSYQRALSELEDHVSDIDIALQKGMYASTSSQLIGLAGEIWSDAGAAKADMSQLSLSNVQLEQTNKFLAQTGDYANSLSKKLSTNEKITGQERATIKSLSENAGKLSNYLNDIITKLQAGKITLFKSEKVTGKSEKEIQTSVSDGFQHIEASMSNLPSMIYDGPFSDNILKKQPSFTAGKPLVSRSQARKSAADFLKVGVGSVKDSGETGGNLTTYNFSVGTIYIYVSKNGGYVVRMIDSRQIGTAKLSEAAADKKANAFVTSRGYKTLTKSYQLTNNNIMMVNFAYTDGNIICYPDLIKVGISLDNGQVVSFDATGYLMNHKTRKFPAISVSRTYIQGLLNPLLKTKKVSLALIPSGGGGEKLCYEFKCVNDKGQNVIDYFNVSTGVEEQIMILIETAGGSLAM